QLLETRKKELTVIEEKISQREEKISEIMHTLRLLETKDKEAIAQLNKETQELAKTREQYESDIHRLLQRKKMLDEEHDDLNVRLSELSSKVEKARMFENDMVTKIDKRRDELVALDKEMEEKRTKMRKEIEHQTQLLEDGKKELAELEEKKNASLGAIAETDELQSLLSRLRASKDNLDRDIAERTKELEKLKIFISRLKESIPAEPKEEKKDQISF
ncbi:MAG: hypothetical protein JSU64_08610, partial [candidate division WOR-3 bacterium]